MRPVSELRHLCVVREKTVTDNRIIGKIRVYLLEVSYKNIRDVYNRAQMTATVSEHKYLRFLRSCMFRHNTGHSIELILNTESATS